MKYPTRSRLALAMIAAAMVAIALLGVLATSAANTTFPPGDPGSAARMLSEEHGPEIALAATEIKFSATDYLVSEGAGHFDVTVIRSGDVTGTSYVDYSTVDHSARQYNDYQIAIGRLRFNPGDTSKTIRILLVDDKAFAAGTTVDLQLVLTNPIGGELAAPSTATLHIMDDEFDTPGSPPNANDDTQLFVRQQYFDFLNREPDAAGLDFWISGITSCGSNQQCIDGKRRDTSAAFFLSTEFQRTGIVAYLAHKAAAPGVLPDYLRFMRHLQALQRDYVFGAPGADLQLELNKRSFFNEFLTGPEMIPSFSGLTNQQFVDRLLANVGIDQTIPSLYIAPLTANEPVPPTGSPATGVAIVRRSITAPQAPVFVSVSFTGLSSPPTSAHIHGPAAVGVVGPVIATLPNDQFGNFEVALTSPQLTMIGNGQAYVDIHTSNYPDGEIRGQLPRTLFIRDMLINKLNDGTITRDQALRIIVESATLSPTDFNRAFVFMEYVGYLRRDPDSAGFAFWLDKLNLFNGDFRRAEMVKAFITSTEYRGRFGPP